MNNPQFLLLGKGVGVTINIENRTGVGFQIRTFVVFNERVHDIPLKDETEIAAHGLLILRKNVAFARPLKDDQALSSLGYFRIYLNREDRGKFQLPEARFPNGPPINRHLSIRIIILHNEILASLFLDDPE